MHLNDPTELRPWAIVNDDGPDGKLALWQISAPQEEGGTLAAGSGTLALAIFSRVELATAYRDAHEPATARVVQLDQMQTLKVLLSAYQQGLRYAALDPAAAAARQVFVLREVLSAAQRKLADSPSRGSTGLEP